MATRKPKPEEQLDEKNILRVIQLLEAPIEGEKPITKKLACELLRINYNTTRLGEILEKFKAKKAREAERRAALRGKPATAEEISYVIQEYLQGGTIDTISKEIFRPATFVKRILEDNAVPTRIPGHTYFKPELIPDGAVRDRFNLGEIVYSARYDSLARVDHEIRSKDGLQWVYRIWLLAESQLQNAYQPAEELASLDHLRKIGVKI